MANNLPTLEQLKQYAVSQQDNVEVIRQTLYDTNTYAGSTGQSSLAFFQTPVGQGGKTKVDTNLENAGQLPAGKNFLVTSIEVLFFPGDGPTQSGSTKDNEFVNDVYTFAKNGYLDLFILSKSYLTEAPLGRFPPKTRLDIDSAVTSTVASTADSTEYAVASGRPYFIEPNITLVSNQNFNVTLNWPTLIPLPSGNDAKVMVVLDGLLYRWSQ